MKKVASIFVALLLAFTLLSAQASALGTVNSAKASDTLSFNSNGKFRILLYSDFQDLPIMSKLTKYFIERSMETYKPDLVVLDGDNIMGKWYLYPFRFMTKAGIDNFMKIFEKYGVPVAMVFGNHDSQSSASKKEYMMSIYEKYDCFIGCAGDKNLTGVGNYNLPIYSSDGRNIAYNLWFIDSLTDNAGEYKENDLGGYGCVHKDQINWYKETSEALEASAGKKVPSMVFQHIIIPEIWNALDEHNEYVEGSVQNGDKYYTLPDGTKGNLTETPCPPKYSNGEFDTMHGRGDVVAMFFGHDHRNSFEINYEGIDLVYTPTSGYAISSYGDDERGVRIIDLNENDIASNSKAYETELIRWIDNLEELDSNVSRRESMEKRLSFRRKIDNIVNKKLGGSVSEH